MVKRKSEEVNGRCKLGRDCHLSKDLLVFLVSTDGVVVQTLHCVGLRPFLLELISSSEIVDNVFIVINANGLVVTGLGHSNVVQALFWEATISEGSLKSSEVRFADLGDCCKSLVEQGCYNVFRVCTNGIFLHFHIDTDPSCKCYLNNHSK